jgi:glutamate racemase
MEPAVKPAVAYNNGKKVLILATSLTLKEKKLNQLIKKLDKNEKVDKMPMDELVKFAEKHDFGSPLVKKFIEKKFGTINLAKYETIVLGCTHFIYFKKILNKICGSNIKIIDGNTGTVNHILQKIKTKKTSTKKKNNIIYYSSDKNYNTKNFLKLTKSLNKYD